MKMMYILVSVLSYLLAGCTAQQNKQEDNQYNKLFIQASVIDSITEDGYDLLYSQRQGSLLLNGPVQHAAIYAFEGTEEMRKRADISESSLSDEISFSPAGKILSYQSFTDIKSKSEYFWDDKQNLVFRISSKELEKRDTTYTQYRHDKYGNLIWKYEYKILEGNVMQLVKYFEYSYFIQQDGLLIVYVKEIERLRGTGFVSEIECTFRDGKIVSLKLTPVSGVPSTTSYTYQSINNKTYLYSQIEDYSGKGAKFKIYKRDDLGRVTESIDSLYSNVKEKGYWSTRIVNEYKENMKHELVYYINTLQFKLDGVQINPVKEQPRETIYYYDEYGNSKKEAKGPRDKPREIDSYEYQYDNHRNWISQQHYYDPGKELASQTLRILTYFDEKATVKPPPIPATGQAVEQSRLNLLESEKYFRDLKYKPKN